MMLCCVCNKNRATKTYVTETDGAATRKQYCAECYHRLFSDVLRQKSVYADAEQRVKRCPYCGTSALDYEKSKLLGCAECYRYLYSAIGQSIRAMQGDEPHCGKTPHGARVANTARETRGNG